MFSVELKDKFLHGINPKFQVATQLVFLPDDLRPQYIHGIQEAVECFFQPNDGSKHIVALQAPLLLGALNLPHFEEWVKKTGSYFEGFVQHCETSGNHDPLPPDKIMRLRDLHETLFENGFMVDETSPQTNEGERRRVQEYMFMTGSLFMIDRLRDKLNIELAVELFSGKELAGLLLRNRRLLQLECSAGSDTDTQDTDTYLESHRDELEKSLKALARFTKERFSSHLSFLNSVILSQGATRKTKILAPMEHLGSLVCYPILQQRSKKSRTFSCLEPGFIGCGGYYPDPDEEILAKFIERPKEGLDRGEVLRLITARIFIAALKTMPGDWSTLRGKMLPQVIGRSTSDELRNVINLAITPDTPPEEGEQQKLWKLDGLSPELQRILSSVSGRKTNAERIVDFYCDKSDSVFNFNPWQK